MENTFTASLQPITVWGLPFWVTSSSLCKYSEGAVFPFQIESLEDGVDHSVHGLHIDETDHGSSTASDFHEDACGSFGLPSSLGEIDGLGIGFDGVVVALADLVQEVAHLVHPAARMDHARIHGLDGGR